jgi:hypothetical protein
MSDIGLKKNLFDQQYSNNSWRDLFGITSTLIFDNEILQISSSSNNINSFNDEHIDQDGHWFLLSSPSLVYNNNTNNLITYSRNSISQQTDYTIPDSCDFHIPTDDINEQNMVASRNKIQQSDEAWRISR